MVLQVPSAREAAVAATLVCVLGGHSGTTFLLLPLLCGIMLLSLASYSTVMSCLLVDVCGWRVQLGEEEVLEEEEEEENYDSFMPT